MELFLNLLWLIIAAGALIAFGRVTRQQNSTGSQRRQAWIALTCVLVLLFFAISMSDDLHQDVAFIEEAWSYKRQSGTLQSVAPDHSPHAVVHYAAVVTVVSRAVSGRPLCFVGFLSMAVAYRFQSQSPLIAAGRDPPLSYL